MFYKSVSCLVTVFEIRGEQVIVIIKLNHIVKFRIIKLCEDLPKFLRGKLEGLLIFNTEFLRVSFEGLI